MRICLVSPYDLSRQGGVNKHIFRLAESLRALGDEVEVLGPLSGALPDERDRKGLTGFSGVVSIQGNASDNRIGLFTSPLAVRQYFRQRELDVLHVHEPLLPSLPYYAVWAARAKVKVATFHCYSEHESAPLTMLRRLFSFHLQSFDRGIAVSPSAARYARVAWPSPLAIIPNGVEASFFGEGPARRDDGGPLRLLFVGQWSDARKGLPYLLGAFALLRKRGLPVTLEVVGQGDTRTPQPVADGVTFHGRVSEAELRRQLHECDVLVAPSTGSESFGMVLTEAMAAGRAIVCSDIEGYRHVVSEQGAALVPPRDAGALARALAALCDDRQRCRQMGLHNRAAARRFDWTRVAPRVRREYELALRGRVSWLKPHEVARDEAAFTGEADAARVAAQNRV